VTPAPTQAPAGTATWTEAEWNIPSSYSHQDVFATGKTGRWFKRLLANVEAAFNKTPLPGMALGCQGTIGMASYGGSAMKLNCCGGHYGSCGSGTSYGGYPVTMDNEAVDITAFRSGQSPPSSGWRAAPMCQWPKDSVTGRRPRPTDTSIHLVRIAPCQAEKSPFCALIKVTRNATNVQGFARIVPPTVTGLPEFHAAAGMMNDRVKNIARNAILTQIIGKADSIIRSAVATMRFEVAQEEIFSQTLPGICLPLPCPVRKDAAGNPDKAWTCDGRAWATSLADSPGAYCKSVCQRRSPNFDAYPASPACPTGPQVPFVDGNANPFQGTPADQKTVGPFKNLAADSSNRHTSNTCIKTSGDNSYRGIPGNTHALRDDFNGQITTSMPARPRL